jgi:HK97 family phage major capsid protein
MRLHELQERRAAVVADMRAIADKAEAESRDYSDAEDKRHKELKAELGGLDNKIERARDLAEAERAGPAILHSGRRGDGAYGQRAREFSLVKAINARLGDPVDDGFEREISAEVRHRNPTRSFQGIAVPDEYFQVEKRVLTVGSGAADLYPTMHRGDLFIDLLRSALVTGRLGATILDGLIGDQDIPRQTASSTAQWVGEDGEITATDASFDDVTLAPKTVGAITSYSRRTLLNAVPSIENIVRRDLASVIANAIDLQAMIGDGTGNTPNGITNAGATSVDLSDGPSWERVLNFIALVQNADADVGAMGWAMNAHAARKLRSTPMFAFSDTLSSLIATDRIIMDAPDRLAGFPAVVTSALPGDPDGSVTEGTVIFGAWSQLLIGYWSGLDILVNPYETTAYARGRVLVRAMRDVDVAVRHAQSFAYTDNMPVEVEAASV